MIENTIADVQKLEAESLALGKQERQESQALLYQGRSNLLA